MHLELKKQQKDPVGQARGPRSQEHSAEARARWKDEIQAFVWAKKSAKEIRVNAGGWASPSSLASWGREETDASNSTSDEAGSGKQGVHKRDAKKQKTSQK